LKLKKPSKKKLVKHTIFTAIGAILGFAYYYFIGCKTGSCPITSSPAISILYGSTAGFILAF